jgi:hypothetical protein
MSTPSRSPTNPNSASVEISSWVKHFSSVAVISVESAYFPGKNNNFEKIEVVRADWTRAIAVRVEALPQWSDPHDTGLISVSPP